MFKNEYRKEEWRSIRMNNLGGLYEISTEGKVRSKPYTIFRGKEKESVKGANLQATEKDVYLTDGNSRGWYNIGFLYYQTFKRDLTPHNIY
tara:strand:- start:2939 stop:3211 length:273 start_codon:yes stop_codon:yes gene_type:complete